MFRAKIQIVKAHWNGARVTFIRAVSVWCLVIVQQSLLASVSSLVGPSSGTETCKRGQPTLNFILPKEMTNFELKHILALLILIAEVNMNRNTNIF